MASSELQLLGALVVESLSVTLERKEERSQVHNVLVEDVLKMYFCP